MRLSELSVPRVISTFGIVGMKVGKQPRNVDVVRRHGADRDGAADQLSDFVDGDAHVEDGGQCGPCVGQHRFTRRGQSDRATRAVQKRLAEFAFQPLDLCADRRLSYMDPLRGPGEVGLLGDGDEVLQLPKFHKRLIIVSELIRYWTYRTVRPTLEA